MGALLSGVVPTRYRRTVRVPVSLMRGTLSPISEARETAAVFKGRPGAKEPGGPWDELPACRFHLSPEPLNDQNCGWFHTKPSRFVADFVGQGAVSIVSRD